MYRVARWRSSSTRFMARRMFQALLKLQILTVKLYGNFPFLEFSGANDIFLMEVYCV